MTQNVVLRLSGAVLDPGKGSDLSANAQRTSDTIPCWRT
jgi:hypothetical protein